MKIGVIGTGNISGTLARKLNEAGHEGKVANSRAVEALRSFCTEQNLHAQTFMTYITRYALPFPCPQSNSLYRRLCR
ncbi:TPA: NAD(P)-binding domain-containing protein [Enterobacter kobei]|nr:NAD(P)-binding domain-containing protein [Enterobacter asburiae]HCR1911374.1 NAD(P)-binding domain-containing protein [Enterobacter kobei]